MSRARARARPARAASLSLAFHARARARLRLSRRRRKEDLELLRAPLKEYDIFPDGRDADSAIITMEELKKLVRHWKLHETRGFWKMHPQKEDLVHALLDHMEDKEDTLGFPRAPVKPSSAKPSKPASPVGRRASTNLDLSTFKVSVLKPYNGDMFSQRDATEGLIYLSRVQNAAASSKSATQYGLNNRSSPRTKMNTFINKDFFAMPAGGEKHGAGQPSHEHQMNSAKQKARRAAIMIEMYRYSTNRGNELAMIEEGALQAITEITETDIASSSSSDPKLATYCAATLVNLACAGSPEVLNAMFEADVTNIVAQLSNHHATSPSVLLCCCITLCHLSRLPGARVPDMIVNSGMHALIATNSVDVHECKKAAVAAMANLVQSDERMQVMEHIMPGLKYLAASTEPDSWLLVLSATRSLSRFDATRVTLAEAGMVAMLSKMQLDEDNVPAALIPGVKYSLAVTLSNLTCSEGVRERMIKDGAVQLLSSSLVDHALAHDDAFPETRTACAFALSNLTGSELAPLLAKVVGDGAVRAFVALADGVQEHPDPDARARITSGLCNLTLETSMLGTLVKQGAHIALLKLAKLEPIWSKQQAIILMGLCNLLSVSENQRKILDGGALTTFENVTKHSSSAGDVPAKFLDNLAKCKELSAMALANIANELKQHTEKTHARLLSMMTALSNDAKETASATLQHICATAFSNFSTYMAAPSSECSSLLSDDVIEAIDRLCASTEPNILLYSAIAFENLSKNPANHAKLFAQGIVGALSKLAQKGDIEVRSTCASTLCNLSTSASDSVEGLIGVLAILEEQSNDPKIIQYSAKALFSISCNKQYAETLAQNASILWRLFGMMRGGSLAAYVSTQLYAAKALCNLACNEECALTLLAHGKVKDFIVIAILRTNNEEVKAVCAECLFNLLGFEKCRTEMIKESVLWALIKLFRVESERTQRIGALVVYNLSCPDSSETAKTVMDIGVTQTLSAVVKQPSVETKFWAAAALCNLSWDLAYAARLVQEGAVSVLRELLTRADASSGAGADDRNDEIYLQCVTALYNMAQGSGKTDEKLVEDGAVPLLESLLETTDPTILELACVALYNISTVEECDVQMVEDQVASCLMKVLLRFTPPLDAEGFEPDQTPMLLLVLGIFYDLTRKPENESALEAAGLAKACSRLVSSKGVPREVLGLCSKIIYNMSWEPKNHDRMVVEEGVLSALSAFLEAGVCHLDAVTALSNLSTSIDLAPDLVRGGPAAAKGTGALALVEKIVRTCRDCDYAEEVCTEIENKCAIVLRNLSCSPSCIESMVAEKEVILEAVQKLAQRDDEDQKFHTTTALYNLVTSNRKMGTGVNEILTSIFQSSTREDTRHICGNALISSHSGGKNSSYSDGSIVALVSTMKSNDFSQRNLDTSPTRLAPPPTSFEDTAEIEAITRYFPRRGSGPTITSDKAQPKNLQPTWTCFFQKQPDVETATSDVADGPVAGAPPGHSLRSQTHTCVPPRSTATSVQGDDMSVSLKPSKIKFSGMRAEDPETEGGEEEEEEEADDANDDLTFNFSVELHVSELFTQKN